MVVDLNPYDLIAKNARKANRKNDKAIHAACEKKRKGSSKQMEFGSNARTRAKMDEKKGNIDLEHARYALFEPREIPAFQTDVLIMPKECNTEVPDITDVNWKLVNRNDMEVTLDGNRPGFKYSETLEAPKILSGMILEDALRKQVEPVSVNTNSTHIHIYIYIQ
jgi:hypothetical protein